MSSSSTWNRRVVVDEDMRTGEVRTISPMMIVLSSSRRRRKSDAGSVGGKNGDFDDEDRQAPSVVMLQTRARSPPFYSSTLLAKAFFMEPLVSTKGLSYLEAKHKERKSYQLLLTSRLVSLDSL